MRSDFSLNSSFAAQHLIAWLRNSVLQFLLQHVEVSRVTVAAEVYYGRSIVNLKILGLD